MRIRAFEEGDTDEVVALWRENTPAAENAGVHHSAKRL